VKDGKKGIPRILIDQNTLSEDKTTTLTDWSISKCGTMLAYQLSRAGNDRSSIHVMDVLTGKTIEDSVSDIYYPELCSWSHTETGFWYTRSHVGVPEDEIKYHHKVYFHKVGTDWKDDPIVWDDLNSKEDSPRLTVSDCGRWLMLHVYRYDPINEKSEVLVLDTQTTPRTFVSVTNGYDAHFGHVVHRGKMYLMTDHDAPNWKIVAIDLSEEVPHVANATTIIPEGKYPIRDMHTVQDALLVLTEENVISVLRRYDLEGNNVELIELPSCTALECFSGEAESEDVYFGLNSFLAPFSVYKYRLKTRRTTIYRKVRSGIRPKDFSVRQVWFSSKDGTSIPMFILSKEGTVLDGTNPTILYGYGGFNISITPAFDREALVFVEEGGVYAMANIRGGGEFGKAWHDAGRREKKQNVFDDFIAAAEWLIDNGYTSPKHLGISGWSNGGLLTAATMVQRPELFGAVVIGAPVIDMLKYHRFDGGRYWIYDYGDPDIPEEAAFLLKYSPYHNVTRGMSFPPTLFLTAEKDDRVHPMHAFKMAALMRENSGNGNPIILRVERKAGHGGPAGVTSSIAMHADSIVFFLGELKK
jgi:prolyl oligopeptidase